MKPKWSLLAIAMSGAGVAALLALVLVAHQYGNQPSASEMGLAAELGAGIGAALTFT